MNTRMTWRTKSTSLKNTLQIAEVIGSRLRGNEVIELVSDLGGGKTSFVKGLAAGIASTDYVHSPSFTLVNEYKGPKIKLFHLDLYRIQEPGLMNAEIKELLDEPSGTIVIEWADTVDDLLPKDRVIVKIEAIDENDRVITFNYPEGYEYLFPENT